VEPFETVYAEVAPGNTSKMAERLPLRGFKEEARSENGTIEFKLTREIGGWAGAPTKGLLKDQ
jgi:hypothetical protein